MCASPLAPNERSQRSRRCRRRVAGFRCTATRRPTPRTESGLNSHRWWPDPRPSGGEFPRSARICTSRSAARRRADAGQRLALSRVVLVSCVSCPRVVARPFRALFGIDCQRVDLDQAKRDDSRVELGGIEPPSISRWTNPLRPFPTSRLSLPHRRVGWWPRGHQRLVFPWSQPSFRPSVVFPTVILRFCCRAAADRPRVALLLTMTLHLPEIRRRERTASWQFLLVPRLASLSNSGRVLVPRY